tara:strand:+ start:76 stop:591 length:516 start_codon:yes stop_codon:yes gene_type:complete
VNPAQPKRSRGRPKQTNEEAAESHVKKKERDAAKRSEQRKTLKEQAGAAYKNALQQDSMRKRLESRLAPYRLAADQGDAAAQFILGIKYEEELNDKGAVHWFRQAANQGHADAQFCLGFAYKYGRGVEQSDKGAVHWYRQAADQGDADAAQSCLEVEAAIAAAEAKPAENK